jgi:hypothetical protein
MAARGKDARGAAVIDDKTTDAELDRLASLGFKGIRPNLSTAGKKALLDDGRSRFLRTWHRSPPLNHDIQRPVSTVLLDCHWMLAAAKRLWFGVRCSHSRQPGASGIQFFNHGIFSPNLVQRGSDHPARTGLQRGGYRVTPVLQFEGEAISNSPPCE